MKSTIYGEIVKSHGLKCFAVGLMIKWKGVLDILKIFTTFKTKKVSVL